MNPDLLNKIHQGDCLEFMKQLPDKCIDLVVTDPPYGIGEAGGKNKSRGLLAVPQDYGDETWDDQIPSKDVFDEIFRVSKNQVIFGGNYFVEYLKNSPCWVVWDKNNGDTDFADCELAWCSFPSAVRKFKYTWNGMLQEDMKNKEKRWHPTQKPVPVMGFCIEKYSEPYAIIFDPFAGSGTTLVAAKQLGRKFLGCELSEKYVAIANERLRQDYLF